MRYTFVNSTDYRKDKIPVKYQLQAIHTTKVMHYNDTLDFLIFSNDSMKTIVKVYIHNQYTCKSGQGNLPHIYMPYTMRLYLIWR